MKKNNGFFLPFLAGAKKPSPSGRGLGEGPPVPYGEAAPHLNPLPEGEEIPGAGLKIGHPHPNLPPQGGKGYAGLAEFCVSFALIFILFSLPAHALVQRQIVQYFRVQSGTGFFVNRQYVITNAHVVKGCDEVYIKGAVPENKANVKVLDEGSDLALLETNTSPAQFAPLRFNIDDLKPGDKVLLMGYPGQEGALGRFSFATAQVENMAQVDNMKGRFFITDVVEHGNSGGPVFDTSGNVIGVVVAKSVLYTVNAVTQEKLSEQHVGVVIDLATLKQFLFDHGVFTEWLGSNLRYDDGTIQDNAKGYIVNVQCRTPESGPGSGTAEQPTITYTQPPQAPDASAQQTTFGPDGDVRQEQGVTIYGR